LPGVGCGNRKRIPGNTLNMNPKRNTNSAPARHIAAKRYGQYNFLENILWKYIINNGNYE